MELLQLKYFQAVAKHENITKAAKELHISQPSLSITIKRLEDELGVPLFRRIGKNIELNQFGKVYLKHVDSILINLDNAKAEVLELYGIRNTQISLSSTATLFLTGLLKEFLISYPNIKMVQSIHNREDILNALKLGNIDFAITSPPIQDLNVETINLMDEEIVVVVNKDHPLAQKKFIYLNELRNENFMELTENYSFRDTTNALYKAAGFIPNIVFEGDTSILSELIDLKKAVLLAPISVCTMPPSDRYNNKYTIIRLKDELNTRTVALSYAKGRYLSELANSFKEFTISYYNDFLNRINRIQL
ncbi:LysR family transcriptional regulator [Clostridium massiliamazoniense]|uniref:LysR family transcriptional regulator n=1 Tax=Clostridium massiliamazoniense TaxID=1347366 RepID=UPI0006D7F746|nr:LysR family transcriptional regulator [Clostridium massiliamazoniense]